MLKAQVTLDESLPGHSSCSHTNLKIYWIFNLVVLAMKLPFAKGMYKYIISQSIYLYGSYCVLSIDRHLSAQRARQIQAQNENENRNRN
jgi:hypothetical protein